MENPYVIALPVVAARLAVKLLITFIVGGFSFARFGLAVRAYFAVLKSPEVARKVEPILSPPPPDPARPPKRWGEPLRLLNLLQREGRLLDFLLEDISPATDEQIGA